MSLALGVLFWLIVIAIVVYAIAYWRTTPPGVIAILEFLLILLLGIAAFGTLHLVR